MGTRQRNRTAGQSSVAMLSLTLLAGSSSALASPQEQPTGSDGKRFAERGKMPEVDVGDPKLNQALSAVANQASMFWQSASSFSGHETLKQKAIVRRRRKVHFRQLEPPPEGKNLEEREITSYYGFSAFSAAPEALREFRRIVSIGDKQLENPKVAREKLERVLVSKDDARKQALRSAFEKEGLSVAAIDFGQLILLFIRSRLPQYSFALEKSEIVGKEQALVISFVQSEGSGSLRIAEPGAKLHIPIEGKLYVRQADDLVLRITFIVDRADGDVEIRDEATVDYSPNPATAILPASILYRRFFNDKLYSESTFQYSDWQGLRLATNEHR